MKEEIIEILNGIKPGVDFEGRLDLISAGVLESFAIIRLVGKLSDEFDVDITAKEIVPENFESVDAMIKMIERLQEE